MPPRLVQRGTSVIIVDDTDNEVLAISEAGKLTTGDVSSAVIEILIGASVGTADNTMDDVGAAHDQTILNNNFKELTDKVNAIIMAMRTAGAASPPTGGG